MSTDRVAYEYVVLRCVPRVDREEFVNVGVVLFSSPAQVLRSASKVDADRLRALAPTVDLEAVHTALATIDRICRGDERAGPAASTSLRTRFGWLAAPRSTVVQPGPVHAGLADDPERELLHLLECLVA